MCEISHATQCRLLWWHVFIYFYWLIYYLHISLKESKMTKLQSNWRFSAWSENTNIQLKKPTIKASDLTSYLCTDCVAPQLSSFLFSIMWNPCSFCFPFADTSYPKKWRSSLWNLGTSYEPRALFPWILYFLPNVLKLEP